MSSTLLLACLVLGVPDGDSLKVSCPDRKAAISVRIAEIDAPEIEHKAFHIAEQPGGRESKAALTALCLKQPAVLHQVATDRYRRMVAKVECNGVNAGEAQARAGHAWAFMAAKRSPIPALVAAAQAQRVGLWAAPHPVAPSVWRKQP